jgi:hypothetical protein
MREYRQNRTRLAAMLLAAGVLTGCQSPGTMSPSGSSAAQSTQTNCHRVPSQTKSLPTNSINNPAAPASTNSSATNRILMIDASSMPIAGGKAILTIGVLQRADGVYSGDYRIKVFPYFLKNEMGRLAIVVSDESLTEINQGKVAAIIGTATTSGKDGRSRHIDATVTPADINRGTLKLWFKAGNRNMIFEPAYHFGGIGTAAALVQTAEPQP